MKIWSLVVVCLSAFGCSTTGSNGSSGPMVWYQPGKALPEIRRDLAACKYDSAKSGSPVFGYNAGSFIYGAAKESKRRAEILENCMGSKGYLLVRQSEVPAGTEFLKRD